MKAWLKEAFKSDQTWTREWRDEIVAEQKALRVQFISEAISSRVHGISGRIDGEVHVV